MNMRDLTDVEQLLKREFLHGSRNHTEVVSAYANLQMVEV